MSGVRAIIDLRARLDEAIAVASLFEKASNNLDPYSRASSYNKGYLDALRRIQSILNDKDEDTL